MSAKRPLAKEYDTPTGVSPKKPHLITSPLPGQQPVMFSSTPPTVSHVAAHSRGVLPGSSGVQQPSLLSGIGSLPPSSGPAGRFEFPSQATNPSGIIPLPLPNQPVRITPSRLPTMLPPQLTAAIANMSSLHRPGIPHYSTDPTSQPAIPSVGGSFSLLGSSTGTPEAPPPPYPVVESTLEDIGCSSPSQFLYSPTSIHVATPAQVTSSLERVSKDEDRHSNRASNGTKELRLKLVRLKSSRMMSLKIRYENLLREKFFLEGGGNLMDYQVWKKRPNILKEQYMKQHDLDAETVTFDDLLSPRDPPQPAEKMDTEGILEQESPLDLEPLRQQQPTCPPKSRPVKELSITSRTTLITTSPAPATLATTPLSQLGTPLSTTSPSLTSPRPPLRTHSMSSVAESSHEDIVMRARHEAEVMKAISELRKEGMWSASRLPKVQEPSRVKTHWDYLLEEMHWLATDFYNERRWKRNAAKKLCRMVSRHHQEMDQQHKKNEKEELLHLRKIASVMAKEVKHFWESIHKIVEHKQQVLLEEKRKRAMDVHLNFIVDQTQKYSSWLVQGLTAQGRTPSDPSLMSTASNEGDSDDALFSPKAEEVTDDEETIEKEEQRAEDEGDPGYLSEIKQLQEEGEMPIDDLLASLPPEMLEESRPLTPDSSDEGEKQKEEEARSRTLRKRKQAPETATAKSTKQQQEKKVSKEEGSDSEYNASSEEEGEEADSTIAEQERHEKEEDHSKELSALQAEGELAIEELLKLYNLERHSATPVSESELMEEDREESVSVMADQEDNEEDSNSSGEEMGEEEVEEEHGLELLVSGKSLEEACQTEQGFTDVVAAAQQFQPKGITLSTTEVKTKVPFLLKHKLREYQHIGLDWLVTMHERRLNGILADEMGLGKTMQTIALLAHLACDKGIWGPHLIVVPTSVLLNWEFELKKWCPAFKILTYFGSYKERKQKRIGWSKYNAFHVCITSYNIAVQDHRAFKQKKWKYLVLDEAQNIKNFKSQRWQTLLTFNTQHRLLLTGTPLQNNLMELWSLMHFLMPTVFGSHSDFKEWFSNPLTGMVEGSQEYNESIIRRLHQVLRPFLLRRMKMEVEKQMPKKYEHIVVCRLSKRQCFLYEDYMSRTKTRETLTSGNYLSIINVLMQLRKVCNHPDLFELRPVVSPFRMAGLVYHTASLVLSACSYDPFKNVNLDYLNLSLANYEVNMDAFVAYRSRQLQAPRALITDLSSTFSLPDLLRGEVAEDDQELEDLKIPSLESKLDEWTQSCYRHMHEVNNRRCKRQPMYGRDLLKTVQAFFNQPSSSTHWLWSGHSTCLLQHTMAPWHQLLNGTNLLAALLPSYQERMSAATDILNKFVILSPPIVNPDVSLHVSHPDPSTVLHYQQQQQLLHNFLLPRADLLHPVATSRCFQFPETRLIQYDCGKLQTLDRLLRELKNNNHRVLIFTQMARMLDILEIFLNYHGHTYLRLDGSTPVTKRQALMERFNRDSRVFCFILSTRSGGLGVNLTGADTVVFYDSDWNPTMDAQAQDRCHRIGQTRDVHIYRLVCEGTVEENILKKANQKRVLGDIAIEGGAFTTDFFKKTDLHDIFGVQQQQLHSRAIEESEPPSQDVSGEQLSQKQLDEMLQAAEEEGDIKAAKRARAEQAAEMAEFDDSYNLQTSSTIEDKSSSGDGVVSRAVQEFSQLEDQLSGVERYAMKFLEAENAEKADERLRQAEADIEQAKKEWELSHLQSLREQEDRIAREEEEEEAMFLTYDRPEMVNKLFYDEDRGDEMPVWFPPSPPSEDGTSDCYIDLSLAMCYDTTTIMTSTALSSIALYSDYDYDVFGLYKPPSETVAEPSKKTPKSTSRMKREHINIPQSLFWRRYTPDILTTRIRKLPQQTKKVKSKADQFTPLIEGQDGPEWLRIEDWILIKGLTSVLEFPLSLTATIPAQMPNWSILSDITSSLGKLRRSPLQCKDHLVTVVIPREEQLHRHPDESRVKSRDNQTKRHKSRRDQRTRSLVLHDKGKECTVLFGNCYAWLQRASDKRKHQNRPSNNEALPRSSAHTDLLKEYGVSIDTVVSPMVLAQQRSDRIQSEITRPPHVPQLFTQNQPFLVSRQYPAAAAAAGGVAKTPPVTAAEPTKPGFNLAASVPTSSTARPTPSTISTMAQLSQHLQQANNPKSNTVAQATTTATVLPSRSGQVTSVVSTGPVTSGVPTAASLAVARTLTNAQTTLSAVAAAAAKQYPSGVDLGKDLLPFAGSRITPQQLLFLQQKALQQQQQQHQQQLQHKQQQHPPHTQLASSQHPPSQPTAQVQLGTTPQAVQLAQTIQLPASIEQQLRTAIPLTAQRVANISSVVRGGLSPRTDEVLALLRQQSLRMAATQSAAAKLHQSQAAKDLSIQGASQNITLSSAAAAAVAAVQQQQQAPKPSVVSPAESMKVPENISLGQLKVEKLDQSQIQRLPPPPADRKK